MSKAETRPAQEDFLAIPDLHGELEIGKRAVDLASKLEATPVFLGDLIGRQGPNVKGTVELACENGTTILGNHELFFLNILVAIKNGHFIYPKGRRYLKEMMKSYSVEREGNLLEDATNLTQAMTEEGHLSWMEALPPFYESEETVMVHAGPKLDEPWDVQRKKIKKQAKPNGSTFSAPIQICDSTHKLSGAQAVPETVDSRIFVTGHRHSGVGAEKRTAKRRVYLTSRIHKGDPLYVWESQTRRIHTIETA